MLERTKAAIIVVVTCEAEDSGGGGGGGRGGSGGGGSGRGGERRVDVDALVEVFCLEILLNGWTDTDDDLHWFQTV